MNPKTILAPFLLVVSFLVVAAWSLTPVQAQTPGPTPTYDPFAEPPLPEHPTQLQSGRYLFWRYCMPCHGDVGQGLTDEFRLKWEPEHQNCWARGCHSGRYRDDSFPVPTVVPPLVGVQIPEHYTPESLFQFLRATHPPEDPGLLSDKEYRDLVAFLYHMNGVLLPAEATAPAPTASPAPTSTDAPASFTPTPRGVQPPEADSPFGLWPIIGLAVILTVLVLLRDRGSAK